MNRSPHRLLIPLVIASLCAAPLGAFAQPRAHAAVVAQAAGASSPAPAAAASPTATSPLPPPAPVLSPAPTSGRIDVLAAIRTLQAEINVLYQRSVVEARAQQATQAQLEALTRQLSVLQQQVAAGASPAPFAVASAPAVATLPSPEPVAAGATPVPLQSIATPAPNAPRRAPAETSVQTVYQTQNALFARGLTFTPSFTQIYSNNRFFTLNGFLALGAIFLGNINVSQQRSDVGLFNAQFTEGVTPRFQIAANAPFLYRDASYSSVGANSSTAVPSEVRSSYASMGDASLAMYYQVATERPNRPNIILNMQGTFPTGKPPYGIKLLTDPTNNNLQYPGGLSTGQGVYGVAFGGSFIKTIDPAIFFGGMQYYHNFPNSFPDISTAVGTVTPGMATPGDAFSYSAGTAFALSERTSMTFSFQDTIQGQTRLKPVNGMWGNVLGSETNAAVLNIGTSYAINRKTSISSQIGIGLTQDAPNFQFGIRLPHQF